MDQNIELRLIGITYNQIENGVYALILEDPEMGRRLPIVIGYPEAQSIECKLQNVKTPRPLSHDLMASLLKALNAKLLRVDIHKLPTGPYAGKLTLQNMMGETIEIDARSSDAIALAIRVGAPIYTNKELIEKEGYIPKTKNSPVVSLKLKNVKTQNKYHNMPESELQALLSKYVEEENYEEAAEVQKEINKRKGVNG